MQNSKSWCTVVVAMMFGIVAILDWIMLIYVCVTQTNFTQTNLLGLSIIGGIFTILCIICCTIRCMCIYPNFMSNFCGCGDGDCDGGDDKCMYNIKMCCWKCGCGKDPNYDEIIDDPLFATSL